MTFTVTLTELLLGLLIIAGIIVLIKLAQILAALLPTLKSLSHIMADAEALTNEVKDKAEGIGDVLADARDGLADVVDAVKGNQSIVKGATNLVNATTSLVGLIKHKNNEEK